MESIEQAFRARRISLGLTQEGVARAAGLARRTVTEFEGGKSGITLGNLNRLLRAVGLELNTREASKRPTLDELSDRYNVDEAPVARRRARRKTAR